MKTCKIALVGSGGTGKTTLAKSFAHNSTPAELALIRMTKGIDIEVGYVPLKNNIYALQIWDFGGQRQFRFFLQLLMKGAKGVAYVYDRTDIETLAELRVFIRAVRSMTQQKPPIEVLVGTKADQPPEVSFKDLQEFTREMGISIHYEVSGLKALNVNRPFHGLVKLIHARETAQVQSIMR